MESLTKRCEPHVADFPWRVEAERPRVRLRGLSDAANGGKASILLGEG